MHSVTLILEPSLYLYNRHTQLKLDKKTILLRPGKRINRGIEYLMKVVDQRSITDHRRCILC